MKKKQSVIRRKATEAFMEVEAGYGYSYHVLVAIRSLISNETALVLIDEEIERYEGVQVEVKRLLAGTPFDADVA